MAHDVFISYSTKDKPVADAVCGTLEANGVRCWVAPRDLTPGIDWGESIIEAIGAAQLMVLVFSSNANDSPQVRREVQRAFEKGMTVIPLRMQDTMPSKSLEYYMSSLHWLDALTQPLEQHLKKLTETVQRLLARARRPTDSAAPATADSVAAASATAAPATGTSATGAVATSAAAPTSAAAGSAAENSAWGGSVPRPRQAPPAVPRPGFATGPPQPPPRQPPSGGGPQHPYPPRGPSLPPAAAASGRATAALITGLGACLLCLLPPLGIGGGVVALILAYQENQAINAGQAPRQGQTFVKVGMISGGAAILLQFVGVAVLASL